MSVEIENVRNGKRTKVANRYAKILVKTGKFAYAEPEADRETVTKQLVAEPAKKRGRPKKDAIEQDNTYETKVIQESPVVKEEE